MYLNRYIAFSVISHLLFISILSFTEFNSYIPTSVFDVKIVDPFKQSSPPVIRNKEPEAIKRKVPVKSRRRRPPEKNLAPERLHGGLQKAEPEKKAVLPDQKEHPRITEKETSKKQTLPGDEVLDLPLSLSEIKKDTTGTDNNLTLPPATGESNGLTEKKERSIIPPDSLFDRKTIQKFARKEQDSQKGLTFEIDEFKHRGYMRMLKQRIESSWKYPKEAAERGISGDLYIKFTILKDGKLGEVELVRTSGYRDLDIAAIKALKKAEPFWPLPDDYRDEKLQIKGHFIYIYGTTYVM